MKIQTHNNIYIRSQTNPEAKADIWLLHGLGESSLSFHEAFQLLKDKPYNLYAPDLPGFGASPPRDDCQTMEQLCKILKPLIHAVSNDRPIHLVGHSMSGILTTELILLEELSYVKSLTSIEGTVVIKPDRTESLMKLSPENSVQETIAAFYPYAQASPAIMRYIASLNFTNSLMLYNFTQETCAYAGKDRSGARFVNLKIPKLYIYGEQSWTDETVSFLQDNNIKTIGIQGGHWPMIDSPEECYQTILKHIESTET